MKIETLKMELKNLATEMSGLSDPVCELSSEEVDRLTAITAEYRRKSESLKAMTEAQSILDAVKPTVPHVEVVGPAAEQEHYSLGAYLKDMVVAARSHRSIPRIDNYQRRTVDAIKAATGSSEAVPHDGGFLVGKDMIAGIIERVYNNGEVASRVSRTTVSTGANGIKMNGIDETSRADGSRHGGVRGYWVAEGDDITGSRPAFRQMEFDLKKLGVLYYATDELLEDATALEQSVRRAVSDELNFKLQDAIINGDGAGKPLGILNAPCLVSQAKETGQTAATINYKNVVKMYSRAWGDNFVWLANRETFPQLSQMSVEVGLGGGAPVWVTSAVGTPQQVLMGYPIIYIEQSAALGTVGDLILADLSQYQLVEKGGVQSAMSVHVEFTAMETVFRWSMRVDGMPSWHAALTSYKGTATRSPFVALATRS